MSRHIWLWFGTLFLLPVLLTLFVSCSSDDQEEEPMLSIYVYAPERPAVTRGEIIPSDAEAKIHNLQIWVFRSSDPTRMVASLSGEGEAGHHLRWVTASEYPDLKIIDLSLFLGGQHLATGHSGPIRGIDIDIKLRLLLRIVATADDGHQ